MNKPEKSQDQSQLQDQQFKHLYVREETHKKIFRLAKRRNMTAINYIEMLADKANYLENLYADAPRQQHSKTESRKQTS